MKCKICKKNVEVNRFVGKDGKEYKLESVLADVQNPYWPGRTMQSHGCK